MYIFRYSSDIFENRTYVTNTKLSLISFENKHINIIKTLSVGKAHSHDNISTKMLKICDSAIISWYLEKIKYLPNLQIR